MIDSASPIPVEIVARGPIAVGSIVQALLRLRSRPPIQLVANDKPSHPVPAVEQG